MCLHRSLCAFFLSDKKSLSYSIVRIFFVCVFLEYMRIKIGEWKQLLITVNLVAHSRSVFINYR